MVKKLRIQLFTDTGLPVSDRLVDQTTEFYQGPKEVHEGPIRVEFTLENVDDVGKSIEYLKKLSGTLPIEQKESKGRGRPAGTVKSLESENDRKIMLTQTSEEAKDQDDFINNLRKNFDFVFIDSDRLKTIIPETYNVKEKHLETYQWLVKLSKQAKDPKNDKFDIALLIGIAILPETVRQDKMVTYLNGTFDGIIRLEVPKKNAMTFKATNLIKYPHYMIYEEREKWGFEHRLLLENPDRKASKFYLRWVKDVQVGDELKLPK